MQIQLKQVEIIEALKQYVAKKGFSLEGKAVDISFTAGRKDTGLSADITIDNAMNPSVEDEEDPKAEAALATVSNFVNSTTPVAVEAGLPVLDAAEVKAPTPGLFG